MAKNKETDINLYYMNGQAKKETLDDIMERKKAKEREKRIRQNQKKVEDKFDFDTETVIGMTNKNNQKKQEAKRVKISKQQRKREKKRKRIKFFLKIFILIAIIVGGIVFATCSPIFNIKNIEVINNNKVSSETIISLSGLSENQNIFKFLKSEVSNKIKENPYIESVSIKRVIPDKIQIDVTERTARFSVPVLGEYVYMSSQGYLLEIAQNELNLPIINGVSTSEEERKPGNRLNTEDLEKLNVVLKIMSIAKENNLDTKVTSIDISNENDYIIVIQEELKTIHLGDSSNLNDKIIKAAAIMEKEKGNEGTIFVNGDFYKNFKPYFRQKV